MTERMDAERDDSRSFSSERVLILDGAMGTMLQQQRLTAG